MDLEEKKTLLLNYYAPTLYQGVQMNSKGVLHRNSYGSVKEQAQAKLDGLKPKVRLPFNMSLALDKHLSHSDNLAVIFPLSNNYIIAWDLDSNEDHIYEVIMSSDIIKYTLEEHGFNPLVLMSGSKGIHIEVRMNAKVANAKLRKLCDTITAIAESKGCKYIDRTYPSKAAYRIFGCHHYKTGKFTSIIKDNRELSEVESWEAFESYYTDGCKENIESKIDKAIKVTKPVKATKSIKAKEAPARASIKDTAKYSIANIEQVHANGLYDDKYTRYFASFQLGRYFKEVLNYTAEQAESECEQWLKRHYPDQALEYFGDDVANRVKTPFHRCVKETLQNCMNGFYKGQSYKPRVILKFSVRKTEKYVDGLKLSKPQKSALRYMIRIADQYNSLIFYHSYEQLSKGFRCNVSTVPVWVTKFVKLGAINIVSKGRYAVNGENYATFYELTIPSNTYEMITANFEALETAEEETALPLTAEGIA